MLKPLADPELADPCRLAIAIALGSASVGPIRFVDLGRGLGLSEGNLASHVRRLVHAGLVEVRSNGARGRASRTEFSLSASGRARLAAVGEALQTAAYAIDAALAHRSLETARRDEPPTPDQGVGVVGGVVGEVLETGAGFTLVDERFSGPD